MARPVGTIFCEVDMSFEPYTRAQKRLLKDATSTTLNIEKNYKDLGIKSAREFDLMRAKISNAYERIARDAKTSADDILRAEKAKNDQLHRLNEEQFGKQTSFIESAKKNWLALAAVAYGAFRAIRSGWELMGEAGDYQERINSLDALGKQYGLTGEEIVQGMKEASRGLVSLKEASDLASSALNLSLTPDQMIRFTRVAESLTDVIGGSIPEAYNRLTVAAASGRLMTLAQMGIIIDLDEVYKKHGKTLSEAQKQQIRTQATLEAAEEKIRALGSAIDTDRDKMERFAKSVADLKLGIGDLTRAFTPLIEETTQAIQGMQQFFNMGGEAKRANAYAKLLEDLKSEERLLEYFKGTPVGRISAGPAGIAETEARIAKLKAEMLAFNAPKTVPGGTGLGVQGSPGYDYTLEDEKKLQDALDKIRKSADDKALREEEAFLKEVERLHAESVKTLGQLEGPNQSLVLERELAKREAAEEKAAAERMKEYKALAEAEEKAWFATTKLVKDETEKQSEFALQSARNMQDSFADFFFDALSGEMRTFGDYWEGFWDSLKRTLANTFAEMALSWGQSEIKNILTGKGGDSIIGGILPAIGQAASAAWSWAGSLFHEGGIVGKDGQRVGRKLAADEEMAVLQHGELVMTREQTAALANLLAGYEGIAMTASEGITGGKGLSASQALGLLGISLGVPGALASAFSGTLAGFLSGAAYLGKTAGFFSDIAGGAAAQGFASSAWGQFSGQHGQGFWGDTGYGPGGGGYEGAGGGEWGGYTFATGGIVPKDTLAKVHEGEGVFTPEQMRALSPAGRQPITVVVPVYLDGRVVSETVYDGVYDASRKGKIALHPRGMAGYSGTAGIDI